MRLTYFADTPHIGGAERHVADMVAHMADAGHDVTVLAPQPELLGFIAEGAPSAKYVRVADDSYHETGGVDRGIQLLGTFPALVRAIASRPADVLHVNNGGYPGSDLCRTAAWAGAIARVPRRVMTVNSMPWPREDSQPAVQKAVDDLLWASLTDIVCPSTIVAESLVDKREAPRSKLQHVRYGVREPGGRDEASALHDRLAPNGELLVGMVSARNVPEKGYDVFVQALARAGDDVRGVLVGPHPGDPFLALVSELGLDDRLTIVGRVPAVEAYYHAIDLLVLPSTREEAMPLVMLEAMAAHTPVYASRLAGVPEAVVEGETGRMFTPSDVDALAGLIADAPQRREELKRMGDAGRRRWEELFAPAALRARLEELYTAG